MNTYVIEIQHYFRGPENFNVEATSKGEAVTIARTLARTHPVYGNGNYNLDSIRCVKKLHKK